MGAHVREMARLAASTRHGQLEIEGFLAMLANERQVAAAT